MEHKYIFTDKTSSQIIDAKQFEMIDYGKNSPGSQALKHRKELEKQTGKEVIGWCELGMGRTSEDSEEE